MKKLFLLVITLVGLSYSQSNNVDTAVVSSKAWFLDTLTTSIDTMDIQLDMDVFKADKITITAVSSAVDTVLVYVKSHDNSFWVQVGVLGLHNNTVTASIFGSTTISEYQILGVQPRRLRLVSTSDDGSTCRVLVTAKRSTPYED